MGSTRKERRTYLVHTRLGVYNIAIHPKQPKIKRKAFFLIFIYFLHYYIFLLFRKKLIWIKYKIEKF